MSLLFNTILSQKIKIGVNTKVDYNGIQFIQLTDIYSKYYNKYIVDVLFDQSYQKCILLKAAHKIKDLHCILTMVLEHTILQAVYFALLLLQLMSDYFNESGASPPMGGFDFELGYFTEDEVFTKLAKFQSMDISVSADTKVCEWKLQQGLLDTKAFGELFGIKFQDSLKSKNYVPTKSPDFVIRFEETHPQENEAPAIVGYRILSESLLGNIEIGVMPGKRLAVIEATGQSKSFSYKSI